MKDCGKSKGTRNISIGNFLCRLKKIVRLLGDFCTDFKEESFFSLDDFKACLVNLFFDFLKARRCLAVSIRKGTTEHKMSRYLGSLSARNFDVVA